MLNIDFQPFPEFSTKRLGLRQIFAKDAHDLYILRSDDEVMLYMDRPKAQSAEEMAQKIKQLDRDLMDHKCIQWAITEKDDDTLVGTICLWNINADPSKYGINQGFRKKWLRKRSLLQRKLLLGWSVYRYCCLFIN